MNPITIHYRQSFFGESKQVVPAGAATAGSPRGLVGRQVANAEMLSALLRYGSDQQINFIVGNENDAQSLRSLLQSQLPSDKQAIMTPRSSLESWMKKPGRRILWEPQPPSASLAWTRSRLAPDTVAMGGVTHALCSALAVAAIRDLVLAPLKTFDRLVCTSEAVTHTARTLIRHVCDQTGKSPDAGMIQLETIPLGIDCNRHRPATPDERAATRDALNIANDEDVVLFVGRLSHHAKSNPLPMYTACQRAARRTGHKVTLILAGWFASEAVEQAFRLEARRVAPDVRLIAVNAMDDQWRDSIWAAADVFVSLADSVQETFGLTVVEAISRGLPVIASDWNGYRESISHDRTGLLVPTTMISGAGERALIDMHEGNLSYDHFLAAVGQTVCVSTQAACEMLESLLASPEKRLRLAAAGQQHARATFDWSKIIPRYERLWAEQKRLIQQHSIAHRREPCDAKTQQASAAIVPSLRSLFELYPSTWIEPFETIQTGDGSLGDFGAISQSKLAGHAEGFRFGPEQASRLVRHFAAPQTQFESVQNLQSQTQSLDEQADREKIPDTVAWLMKFDLLRTARATAGESDRAKRIDVITKPDLTFTTTCMGRLDHLRQSLPLMVDQPGCHVVVVDYSCPDHAGRWVAETFSPEQVSVVHLPGREFFDRSEAKNAAIIAARTPWICVIDADILVVKDFARQIRHRLGKGSFLRRVSNTWGVGGTFVAWRETVLQVGMHDPVFQGWGEEDADLLDALGFAGERPNAFPDEWISHLDHDDQRRTQFHQTQDQRLSHLVNRVYRTAKWDLTRVTSDIPSLGVRQELYQTIREQLEHAAANRTSASIVVPVGKKYWNKLSATGARSLTYHVDIDRDF